MAQPFSMNVYGTEQMKQTLHILANAGDLSVFNQQFQQAVLLINSFQQLTALPVADARPVVRAYGLDHRMAKLLALALSTGIRLVVQTQQQRGSKSKAAQKAQLRAIDAITLLSDALAILAHGWVTLAACEADRAANQLQFARQVAETELLTTFAEACTSTASTLEQLNQQQQQQEVSMSASGLDSRAAAVSHLLMVLAVTLESVWPGKLLVGSTIAPCVEPVNRLALAILRTRTRPVPAASSSIERSSPVEPTYLWLGSLAKRMLFDLTGHSHDLSGMNPQIVQQLASDTLLQLLAANLAIAARLLHEHHSSKQAVKGSAQQPGTGVPSPAKQQQQQQQVLLPQPYHEELLQLLDVPALQQLELKHEVVTQLQAYATVVVMCFAWRARSLLPQPTNISSSSSSNNGSINHSISGSSSCCEAAAGIPMLLVLLEVIVLSVDDPELSKHALQVLLTILLDRAETEAAGLLQPVLSQLGPAVQQAATTASSEVAAVLTLKLLKVLRFLANRVPPAGLAAAITQQPAVSCQTLEAAIRCGAAELDDHSMTLVYDVVLALKEGDPSWQAASAEAGAEAHLFALLASCMKAAAAVASAWSSSSAGLQRDSIAAAYEMLLLFQHTDAMPWLLLKARALQAFGQMVAGICSADAASVRDQPRCISITGDFLLAECARCVEGLGPKLAAVRQQGQPAAAAAAAAAEALQQLMEQQQDLQHHLVQQQQQQRQQGLLQQVQPVQQQDGGSNSIMVPGSEVPVLSSQDEVEAAQLQQEIRQAFTAQLGQQLQQFGAAVQTQLPLQWWCNHPGCTNLDKLSELALVGGKACICAGCIVARYCSKSCQEAHWKKQHKPVCRRLAAAKQ